MKIIGATWTNKINYLKILCKQCGDIITHRSDRWQVYCTNCGNRKNLQDLRDDYGGCSSTG